MSCWNEHPRWNTNSFQVRGMETWPSISGYIISPLVCPWMVRMHSNLLQEFLTILKSWLVASFSKWSWFNICQWNSFLNHIRIWFWASDLWISNESLHLTISLANFHVVPIYWHISRLGVLHLYLNSLAGGSSQLLLRTRPRSFCWTAVLSPWECSLSWTCTHSWATSSVTFLGSLHRNWSM